MAKNGEKIVHLLRRHAWKLPRRLSCNFCIFCDGLSAAATLNDAKLLNYFKEVDQLPDEEKNTILKVVAALIHEYKTQQIYAL